MEWMDTPQTVMTTRAPTVLTTVQIMNNDYDGTDNYTMAMIITLEMKG